MTTSKIIGKLSLYMKAGFASGSAAALLNIIIYITMTAVAGRNRSLLILGSVLITSLLPNLPAAAAYAILENWIRPEPR